MLWKLRLEGNIRGGILHVQNWDDLLDVRSFSMMFVPGDDRDVFCHSPVLGCAPVPPQNRYFRSLREWFCISSILVWLTSSSLSPESFHSKFPFLAADLSLTGGSLCSKKDSPQLHFLAKFLIFYIYFLSMLILFRI